MRMLCKPSVLIGRQTRCMPGLYKKGIGLYKDNVFEIELTDPKPYAAKAFKAPHADSAFLREEVKELIDTGIAEPCRSPWALPALCVHRIVDGKDKRRMCVDFRALNEKTISDAFPMPDCDSLLARLKNAQYYATLDLKSGFWQVGLGP